MTRLEAVELIKKGSKDLNKLLEATNVIYDAIAAGCVLIDPNDYYDHINASRDVYYHSLDNTDDPQIRTYLNGALSGLGVSLISFNASIVSDDDDVD